MQDLDGSLTGIPGGGWATPFYKYNLAAPFCSRSDLRLDLGIACNSSVVVRRLQVYNQQPAQLNYQVGFLQGQPPPLSGQTVLGCTCVVVVVCADP